MEKNKDYNPAKELNKILQDGINGYKGIEETRKSVSEFADSNLNLVLEIETKPLDQTDKIAIQFEVGKIAIGQSLGSRPEPFATIELTESDNIKNSSYLIGPGQFFNILNSHEVER